MLLRPPTKVGQWGGGSYISKYIYIYIYTHAACTHIYIYMHIRALKKAHELLVRSCIPVCVRTSRFLLCDVAAFARSRCASSLGLRIPSFG